MSQRLSSSSEAQRSTLAFFFFYFLRRYKMTGREGIQTAGVPLFQLGVRIYQKSRGENTRCPKTLLSGLK